MDEVRSSLRRIAAFGLDVDRRERPPIVLSGLAWPSFLAGLANQRLTGLAVAAAEEGELELRGSQEAELLERHRQAMMLALTLEARLLTLVPALEASEIDYAALKGPAVAHTRYPDPSLRPFGDLDVLVRSEDLGRACDVLSALGFRRVFPEPRPRFVERFGNTVLHRDDAGTEVDLHHTLVSGPFGQWIEPAELLGSSTTFRLGGRQVRRLNDTGLLLHACIHASLGHRPPLLMPVRDVGQVLRTASIDEDVLESWARRWHLRGVVGHAVRTAREMTGAVPSPSLLALCDQRLTRRERWALKAYATKRRERGGRELATLRAIRGIGRKQAFVRALLFPDRSFLDWRVGGGRYSLLRRWRTPLSWFGALRRRHRPWRPAGDAAGHDVTP